MRERLHRRAYRLGEISELIGVPPETLKKWCERGEIPYFKIGTTFFVSRDHVERTWQI